MRTAAVVALLLLPALAFAQKPKVELELVAPKEIYPDETITVKAVLHNLGKDDLTTMRNVDGAFDRLRGVVDFRWVVKKNGQLLPRRTDVRRIDNHINTIRAEDLVKIPAGKSADLGADYFETQYNITQPGKYTIELRYEFEPSASDKMAPGVAKTLEKLTGFATEGKTEVTIHPFPLEVAKAEEKMKVATARHQIVTQFAEAVVKNPASTAAERDAAAERLKRATAVLTEATEEYNTALAEFRKKREADRKKK